MGLSKEESLLPMVLILAEAKGFVGQLGGLLIGSTFPWGSSFPGVWEVIGNFHRQHIKRKRDERKKKVQKMNQGQDS